MGTCVSRPAKGGEPLKFVKVRRRRRVHCKKHHLVSVWPGNRKRKVNAGPRVADFVSDSIHTANASRSSELPNPAFDITQLQWYHGPVDANGISQEEAWFDTVSILEPDSDDDFSSADGDSFLNISNGQVLPYELSPCIVGCTCDMKEYDEIYLKINNDRPQVPLSKDADNEPNRLTLNASPESRKKRSAVIQLSFKTKSTDNEGTNEACENLQNGFSFYSTFKYYRDSEYRDQLQSINELSVSTQGWVNHSLLH